MKSEPRLPDESVNQGGQRPIKDLIVLMSAAFAVLMALVIAVGLLTDVVVRLVPRERESTLLRPVVSAFLDDFGEGAATQQANQALQTLFDKVRAVVEPMPYEFQLKLACTPMVNAMALPGGAIVVTSGLLKLLRNEDQLSFVLAHELGHFVGRDHLQGLGRGLTLSIALGIGVPGVNQVLESFSEALLARHSRAQEAEADEIGVAALMSLYGHAQGAQSALLLLEEARGEEPIEQLNFHRSHPVGVERRRRIAALVATRAWRARGQTTALSAALSAPCSAD